MPRDARIIIIGAPHHVTQRGNGRQQVFFDGQDFRAYLKALRSQSRRYGLLLNGLWLMPNHIHLIATPRQKNSLSKSLGITNQLFADYFHRKYQTSGHLWQSRFFSCPLEGDHAWKAMKYVELNPVRSSICKHPGDYQWSSAKIHLRGFDPTGFLDLTAWNEDFEPNSWKEILGQPIDENFCEDLRVRTLRGK